MAPAKKGTSSPRLTMPRKRKIKPVEGSPLAEVAAWFLAKRQLLGKTQKEMSAYCDLPQSTISDMERGDPHVRISTLLKALERLGGSLSVQERPLTLDLDAVYDEESQ